MDEREETILIVDDEENILHSLRRLFRSDGYRIITALTAEEGLQLLDVNAVWLVISDNAMPGMSGIEFLKKVCDKSPTTVRIMLTGCADLLSAVEAINKGEVYRFVTKPWDPEGLKNLVKQGLDQYRLVHDNQRMRALIEEQNDLLKRWNESLQRTVDDRTDEVTQKKAELEKLYVQLQGSFFNTIKVFTGLVELRNRAIGGHARRIAALSKSIALQMELGEDAVKNVEVAALLHDIGKIGLPDEVLRKDERFLSPGERTLMRKHPLLGQAALQMVDNLESIGVLVRHHHELWDGTGYPDKLRGEAIPLPSRIIAVADALDRYQEAKSGNLDDFIEAHLKMGYDGPFDPSVVLALKRASDSSPSLNPAHEVSVPLRELKEGMVVSRDVRSVTGILLIPKEEALKQVYIDKLITYELRKLVPSTAYVYSRASE
ncbi:MAG: response regulator [Chloroflexi bacterium]|nr:response regulator [Chloroflexota bacterium]